MLTSCLRLTTLAVPRRPPYPAWAWSFSGQSAQADSELGVCFNSNLYQLAWLTRSSPFPTCFFSDEDIDVGALLKSWLRGQPEECRSNLENWLGDYFQRALDWVIKQVPFVLSCLNKVPTFVAWPHVCWTHTHMLTQCWPDFACTWQLYKSLWINDFHIY